MKRITLCADDFGMHPAISEAIAILAQKQRIQATSALVTSPLCQQDVHRLDSSRHLIDIGLHLNFTEGHGISQPYRNGLPGLLPMLWRSHCRLLSPVLLTDEIRGQLDTFETLFGMTPDFIDGHQHVHHLPQVRQALLKVINERQYSKLWLRSVSPMVSNVSPLKSKVIEGSGANQLRTLIERSSYSTNTNFAGVYSLSEGESYEKLMRFWLKKLPDNSLIMCHPGLSIQHNGSIDHAQARLQEFHFLNSERFTHMLQSAEITPSKLSLICN